MLPPIEMTPDLILLIFLPAVLFEASWNIKTFRTQRRLEANNCACHPGSSDQYTLIVAYGMHYLAHVELGPAFLFGAMIAATDPISVLALFRKLGMDSKLQCFLKEKVSLMMVQP
jgi:CPA1 family monovalent cation:H+ antiporter